MIDPNTPLPLNTGATIPALGLGTWQSPAGQVKTAVLHAIKLGYRHIDAAFVYGNEPEVGQAIAAAIAAGLVTRDQLFVTTKLWCTYHSRVAEGLAKSLENLGLEYVDLYLMHWPVPMNPNGNHPNLPTLPSGARDLDTSQTYAATWASMEALVTAPSPPQVRAIGVANFSVPYLTTLLRTSRITPAANQIENHPLLPQQEIVDFCRARGIHVTAYSPLGSTGSPLFKDEGVLAVARDKGVSAGCVLLSYHVKRGCSVLAKSVNESRIEENMRLVELDEGDMRALGRLSEKGVTRFVYPSFGVDLGFPDKQ